MNCTEIAVIGGGCFWCIEAVFENIDGILYVISGYAGGNTKNPSYSEVCTGTTGHAEVVQITFNPEIIGFKEILTLFFQAHDPTTINQQGADIGTQYRSIILYQTQEQKNTAEKYIDELKKEGLYSGEIVTEVVPLDVFYPAEEYHQDFFEKNPDEAYCRIVITPKLHKLGLS
jgi:peptide-methionine (S)-S-oxide reductase